jgi:hemerythrin-like domain-containing protein
VKTNISQALVDEHKLILRMIALLEKNSKLTAEGNYDNWQFYLDGVDFIRNYADRFHHAKEEDVLFEALVKNGMPRKSSPIEAMLMEHDQGRAYVGAMEKAAQKTLAGETGQESVTAENALAYVELLRGHISKEDDILYPLAERVLPEEVREGIMAAYRVAEAKTANDFSDHYRQLVEGYERE